MNNRQPWALELAHIPIPPSVRDDALFPLVHLDLAAQRALLSTTA